MSVDTTKGQFTDQPFPWKLAAMKALKFDLRDRARRYGAIVEDSRVEM